MNFGEKLRAYRVMRNMTQKELGMKIGFSATTADSRIRRYESGSITPKADIREKLAKALEVDLSAISDIDVATYEDLMHIFFLLEKDFGMTVSRSDTETILSFDNNNAEIRDFLGYLYAWELEKERLNDRKVTDYENAYQEYRDWKARFPQSINSYLDEQYMALSALYDPLVAEHKAATAIPERMSDLVLFFQKLAQTGIYIDALNKDSKISGYLSITFLLQELMEESRTDARDRFTEYLIILEAIKQYGIPVNIDLTISPSGTFITYDIYAQIIGSLAGTIHKMVLFEQSATKSAYEADRYNSELKFTLNAYNLSFQDEMEFAARRYNKKK